MSEKSRYERLVAAGAPALPEEWSYRIFAAASNKLVRSISSLYIVVIDEHSNPLTEPVEAAIASDPWDEVERGLVRAARTALSDAVRADTSIKNRMYWSGDHR